MGGGWSCADVVVVRTPRKLGFDAQRADGAARSQGWGWVQIARPGEQGRQHAMVRTLAGRWVWIRGGRASEMQMQMQMPSGQLSQIVGEGHLGQV